MARGEADEASDIDLLVNLEPGRSLMDLGRLLYDLQILLVTDVDVVTEKGRVLASANGFYARRFLYEK